MFKHLDAILQSKGAPLSVCEDILRIEGWGLGQDVAKQIEMHLHFHLIPRFEGDKEGFMHLFERELEGARWIYDCKREECKADCKHTFEKECRKKYDKINGSSGRLLIAECVVERHESWICSDRWAKSNEERESFIKQIKEKIEEII